ncbi:MAG: hypothetical protein JNM70_23960 [Anaerolineae bacterium]|nr:hypothetical protein [Anaerolineae bacterium]
MASWRFIYALLWGLLAACVPATVPANLDDTPGPPVIVADGWYRGVTFSARYPDGWRIVTGEAQRPQSVVFVAPDEVSTITLQLGDAPISGDTVRLAQQIRLSERVTVSAMLASPDAAWEAVRPVYENTIASIRLTEATNSDG